MAVVFHALRLAGEKAQVPADSWETHPAGDGQLIVFPAEIDESSVIAAITIIIQAHLADYNLKQTTGKRLRVRISFAQGTLHSTPFGFCDDVTIGVRRLVDCSALRAALADHPASNVAVVVSDDLYHDVIAHERHGLPAASFWRVVATAKNFRAPAWIHVPHKFPDWTATRTSTPPVERPGSTFVNDVVVIWRTVDRRSTWWPWRPHRLTNGAG